MLTRIEDQTFENCRSLDSVEIPNTVTSIGKNAFERCYSLRSLFIPNSVKTIHFYAFSDCQSLKEIHFQDGDKGVYIYEGAFYSDHENVETLYLGRNVGSHYFNNLTNLKNLTIGNTVTSISAKSFKRCKGVFNLVLGSGLTSIPDGTFEGFTNLKKVVIPSNVESIGQNAFKGCTALGEITIGSGVREIGDFAFDGCKSFSVYACPLTPPKAENNVFSVYKGQLYVNDNESVQRYSNAWTCWDQFNAVPMITPTHMEASGEKLTFEPGTQIQLTASLKPDNVTLPNIFWESTNPQIATVDHNGLVTFHWILEENSSSKMRKATAEEQADCKIIARSLYANGPEAIFTSEGITNGVCDIISDKNANGEIDYTTPYEVYNLSGICVASSRDNLASGIYIVRQGATTNKIAIR